MGPMINVVTNCTRKNTENIILVSLLTIKIVKDTNLYILLEFLKYDSRIIANYSYLNLLKKDENENIYNQTAT